jgi:hypothetical protein
MRYLAFTLPKGYLIANDVPFRETKLGRGINRPGDFTAKLDAALGYRKIMVEETGEDVELIREWGTFVVAWDERKARGYIVHFVDPEQEDQETLVVQGYGVGSIPVDMPWKGEKKDYVDHDPLDIVRDIWAHATSFPDSIPVAVGSTKSPVRVGEPEETRKFSTGAGENVEFDVGPRRLNWWSTENLGQVIEGYAKETPFEWREHTTLDFGAETPPAHRIQLGYPIIRPRAIDRYFEVGVNVISPDRESDEEYCNEVVVLGTGEGSLKRRGEARRSGSNRMRKPKVYTDQSLDSNEKCREKAQEILAASERDKFWTQVTVQPHPSTPYYTYDVGDSIDVRGLTVWGRHTQRCRIIALEHITETDLVRLTLEPWS